MNNPQFVTGISSHLRRAPLSRISLFAVLLLATLTAAYATTEIFKPISQDIVLRSAAMSTLMDAGQSLRADIARIVAPALLRTQKLAADPATIAALRQSNPLLQTQTCNNAVTSSTEIDAFAMFNSTGHIVAINNVFASGKPIPPLNVNKLLAINFEKRPIIQKCISNAANNPILAFQTTCVIAAAFFDSSGLSVAYSVPVLDPDTHTKIGVVSSRVRFDRLAALLQNRTIGGKLNAVNFIADNGKYFSEDINAGRTPPPIPLKELAAIVSPTLGTKNNYFFTQHNDDFLAFFPLQDFSTTDGGNIQVMLLVSKNFLLQEAQQAQRLHAAAIFAVALLLFLLAALLHGFTSFRQSARWNRLLLDSALDAVIAIDQHGLIRSWNPQATTIFGFSQKQALVQPLHLLLHADPSINTHPQNTQLQMTHLNGSQLTIELAFSPIKVGEHTWHCAFLRDVTQRNLTQEKLRHAQKIESENQLALARAAGMAEVASSVLHNVGNVLNSVNTSVHVARSKIQQSPVSSLSRAVDLLIQNKSDLGAYITSDLRGREIPNFLEVISRVLTGEQGTVLEELNSLASNIDHISQIISVQQSHAKPFAIFETIDLNLLIEESLRTAGLLDASTHIHITRQLAPSAHLTADKHAVLQILLNLFTNARQSLMTTPPADRKLTLRTSPSTHKNNPTLQLEVIDNGIGIETQNVTRIFNHGFTTKKDGHGFGLHSSANAAISLGGSLTAHSPGPNQGATFFLQLPLSPNPLAA